MLCPRSPLRYAYKIFSQLPASLKSWLDFSIASWADALPLLPTFVIVLPIQSSEHSRVGTGLFTLIHKDILSCAREMYQGGLLFLEK